MLIAGDIGGMKTDLALFSSEAGAHAPLAQETVHSVDAARLDELEPALGARCPEAFHLPGEAQVDNRALLEAVAVALEEASVPCHWQTFIPDDPLPDAGVVVDCRGMGARHDWPQLRGVRGEIARLAAPEIDLRHMLRLLHPRYSVYVVPRAEGKLVVGATSIESDDRSPVSVRGSLELLSSAFSMLPALAEARILEFATQVRPALPDNQPAFQYDRERRLLRINGLYRHGFLLTPTIVEEALAVLSGHGEMESTGRWSCLRRVHSGSRNLCRCAGGETRMSVIVNGHPQPLPDPQHLLRCCCCSRRQLHSRWPATQNLFRV